MTSASAFQRLGQQFSALLREIDWSGLGRAYLFFWYFSGLCHVLLILTGATGWLPLRQGLFFSLLWLIPLLIMPKQARSLAAFIGVVLWAASLVNLGYFAIYRQEFSQSVLFIIFESNPAEASEYIDQYLVWWMLPALLVYSAVPIWLWRRIRPLAMPAAGSKLLIALIVIVLVVPPAFKSYRKRGGKAAAVVEAIADRMEPAVPWQMVIGFAKYRAQLAEMQSLLSQSQRIPPIGNLTDALAGKPATVVLVLGESTNRQHMSLYGYPRQTSPKLEAMRDQLVVFNQVFSSRPYTIEVLQQVLTFADQENPNLYLTKPSLMNIMKQAGYKTYWITNQQTLTKRNTMLTNFSEQMDEQYYLNHSRSQNSYQFDEDVLEPFGKILADGEQRKFIVVHLLGTHMRYKYRYPPEFEKFKTREGLPAWATEAHAPQINEYDNAILYNDHVVSSLVRQLSSVGSNALLVYFSDHGEDVYDWPDHDFIGRNEARPTPPMYAIPFFLWSSDLWKKQNPRNFDGQRDRIYQISHFIHTWADLTGLRFDGFDPTKSLVNAKYQERPLLVGNPTRSQSLIDLRDMLKK